MSYKVKCTEGTPGCRGLRENTSKMCLGCRRWHERDRRRRREEGEEVPRTFQCREPPKPTITPEMREAFSHTRNQKRVEEAQEYIRAAIATIEDDPRTELVRLSLQRLCEHLQLIRDNRHIVQRTGGMV